MCNYKCSWFVHVFYLWITSLNGDFQTKNDLIFIYMFHNCMFGMIQNDHDANFRRFFGMIGNVDVDDYEGNYVQIGAHKVNQNELSVSKFSSFSFIYIVGCWQVGQVSRRNSVIHLSPLCAHRVKTKHPFSGFIDASWLCSWFCV